MKVLQCHSRGNKNYSPFFASVEAFGRFDTIENHYQRAKRFEGVENPRTIQEAKAYQKQNIRRVGFELPNGLWLPPSTNKPDDLAVQYYISLWYKHLLLNSQKIEYAGQFDAFNDPFAGQFPFCQARVIEYAVKHGIEALRGLCEEFLVLCHQQNVQNKIKVKLTTVAPQNLHQYLQRHVIAEKPFKILCNDYVICNIYSSRNEQWYLWAVCMPWDSRGEGFTMPCCDEVYSDPAKVDLEDLVQYIVG